MCKWGKTKECFVNVPAEDSHTGVSRWTLKSVDACIADIVDALNGHGLLTEGCCCGHGKYRGSILLQDGRELFIGRRKKRVPKEK